MSRHLPFPPDRGLHPESGRALTLTALLVGIAIIGMLASLLLPAWIKAKEQANRTRCVSNFRQVLLSTHMYACDNNDYLPYTSWDSNARNLPNWLYTRLSF